MSYAPAPAPKSTSSRRHRPQPATPPTAVQVASPATTCTMKITVPEGTAPGARIQFRTPSGKLFNATVPPNTYPGQEFKVEVPIAEANPAPAPAPQMATPAVPAQQGQQMYQQAMAPNPAPVQTVHHYHQPVVARQPYGVHPGYAYGHPYGPPVPYGYGYGYGFGYKGFKGGFFKGGFKFD